MLEALVVRNVMMYTVVAAIMLVAGFGIYNIVSTITHEKARDIAIMKSLGFAPGDMQAPVRDRGHGGRPGRLAARLVRSASASPIAARRIRFEIARPATR